MPDQDLSTRQRYITRPLLNWVRGILPRMSDTEREALEAGTIWWDAELMRGDPDFSKLLSTPVHKLTAEEQAFLDGPTEYAQTYSPIDGTRGVVFYVEHTF